MDYGKENGNGVDREGKTGLVRKEMTVGMDCSVQNERGTQNHS